MMAEPGLRLCAALGREQSGGLAADDIDGIDVAVGSRRQSVMPGRDGAFIAHLPPQQGQVELTLRSSAGIQEQLTLPAPPDIAELNELLDSPRRKADSGTP